MGLKDLLNRWRRGESDRAVERAKEESRMAPAEREIDQEDFEATKDDRLVERDFAGSEALDTAREDLED